MKNFIIITAIGFALLASVIISPQGSILGTKAYAQAATAEAPVLENVDAPKYFDKLIELLKSSAALVAGLVVAFEVALRAFPTVKPLSLLVPLKYAVDSLLYILGWLSNLLVSLINVANKSKQKLPPTV